MSNRLPVILAISLLIASALCAALWISRVRVQEELEALRADNAALQAARVADHAGQALADKLTQEACDAARQSHNSIDAALAADNADLLPELCRVLRQTADRAAAAAGKSDAALPQSSHAGSPHADR